MHDSKDTTGSRRRPALVCPLCRKALAASPGPGGVVFECSTGHVFDSRALLQEHTRQGAHLIKEIGSILESKIAVATELAAQAYQQGRHHMVTYLKGELEDARRKLALIHQTLPADPS